MLLKLYENLVVLISAGKKKKGAMDQNLRVKVSFHSNQF